jgi:hypothetical protein
MAPMSRPHNGRSEERGITVKQLVGLAGMLLASSARAGEQGHVAVHRTTVTLWAEVTVAHHGKAGLTCEGSKRHKPAPELVITITPSKIEIPDNSKQGTPLAKVTVGWSNGAPHHGKLTLTKNLANPRGDQMPSHMNDAWEWLDRAEQAREVAGQLTDPGAKRAVLQLAESFERLARAAGNPAVLRRRELARLRQEGNS